MRFRVVTSLAPSRDLLARGAPAADAMLDRMAPSSRTAPSLRGRLLGSAAARSTWMSPTALLGIVGAVGLAATTLLTGCGSGGERPNADAAATGPATPGPGEYLPGLPASVGLPTGDPTAVVVLVPGGGWSSADRAGLAPLAAHLTDNGLAVVTITYGTSGTDAYYPRPVDDVACAVAYAAEQVPDVPVVLVGHSAGAQLVALAGLVPDRDDVTCPYPPYPADAVVGLAGPYDVTQTGGLAENLFGVPESEDPELWRDGNPLTWTAERPEVPFLLVHGEDDRDVAMQFTDDFTTALTEGGHDVTVEKFPGVTHLSVFTPEVVGDLLVAWITAELPS